MIVRVVRGKFEREAETAEYPERELTQKEVVDPRGTEEAPSFSPARPDEPPWMARTHICEPFVYRKNSSTQLFSVQLICVQVTF